MIVAHISDTHIALDIPDSRHRLDEFARTIADINALDPQPDVIVHTGDIAHNGHPDEYAEAMAIFATARAPVYVLPGNRDDRANLRAAFSRLGYFSRNSDFLDYVIEDYPVRLIALDTLLSSSNKGDYCRERLRHLSTWIGAEQTKPIAVFSHHPPFPVPVGPTAINFARPEIMEELGVRLQQSGRVVGVFSGHVHRAVGGNIGNIPAVIVPCIATALRYGEFPPEVKSRPLYYVYRFKGFERFSVEPRVVGP